MVTILQTLTEISWQMQTFDDLEHTSRSLNACIYYEIQCVTDNKNKWFNDGRITSNMLY